jgi:hypothetical protein
MPLVAAVITNLLAFNASPALDYITSIPKRTTPIVGIAE